MNDEPRGGGFPPASDPYGNGNGDSPPEWPPPPPAVEEPLNLPPWEDRSRYSWIAGFFETIRLVITAPGAFFHDHPARRRLLPPVLFALVVGILGAFVEWVWSRVFSDLENSLDALLGQYQNSDAVSPAFLEFLENQSETIGLLISPVTVLVVLFITAGLIHLGVLFASRNQDRGFEGTLRVCAYSDAVNILILIPGCGGLIAFVWGLVIKIIGLREMHGLGTGGAILAVVLPLVLCCCGFAVLAMLIGGLAGFGSG